MAEPWIHNPNVGGSIPSPATIFMPTPKQQIIDSLTELAVMRSERESLVAKQEKAVAKYRAEFERATTPILEKYNGRLAPVSQRIAALEKEVEAALLNNLDADGNPKLKVVSTNFLVAEVVQSAARREIDAEKFFNEVPALQRNGSAFWDCLSVQIGNAAKFLGERINEIAKVKPSFKVVIKLKQQ